jgi:hypothetical protein
MNADYDSVQNTMDSAGDPAIAVASGDQAANAVSQDAAASGPALGDPSNPLLASTSAAWGGIRGIIAGSAAAAAQADRDADATAGDAAVGKSTDGDVAATALDFARINPLLRAFLPTGADGKKAVDDAEGVDPTLPGTSNPYTFAGSVAGGSVGAIVGGPVGEAVGASVSARLVGGAARLFGL